MTRERKPVQEGLLGQRGEKPDLRELTISMGRSDIYVNLARRIELENGHTLFEAILTDDQGSRVIYLDRDDVAECVRESIVMGGPPPAPREDDA